MTFIDSPSLADLQRVQRETRVPIQSLPGEIFDAVERPRDWGWVTWLLIGAEFLTVAGWVIWRAW